MGTDPNLAGLFEDLYAAVGHHPHHLRSLLQQLLANATGGGAAPGSGGLASALTGSQAAAAWQAAPFLDASALAGPSNSSSGGDPSSGGPVAISVLSLFLATALVAVNGVVSLWLHLGLHSKLVVATIRCIVQLSLLGYILVPIFVADRWWLTFLYTLFMLGVAAIEAVSRPSQNYAGMLPQVLVSLGTASSLVISYGLAVVVQVQPWYEAQYIIPMMGMLLGNACSGIAVGLSTVLDDLSTGRDKVEMLLSMGATRMEATRDVVQRAVKMAMTPLLNQMSVVGVVSIPGMMTGQILGGSDPATAARYQIVIMFLIAATTALSSVAAVFMAVLSVIDGHHRLRSERLRPKAAGGSGALGWIAAQARKGWEGLQSSAGRLATRVRLAFGAVTGRTRHKHRQFGRPGSPVSTSAVAYSRVGSRGEEEEGGGASSAVPERSPSLRARLEEVLVGGSGSDSSGLLVQAVQSPRQPLLGGESSSPGP